MKTSPQKSSSRISFGTEPQAKASTMGWLFSNLMRPFTSTFNFVFGDTFNIIRYKDEFILKELTHRALQSKEGYASTYIGFPFLKAASFFVFTGRKFVTEGVAWGEYSSKNPDPKARSLFDPLKDFLGIESIINLNGPEVPHERGAIKGYLTRDRAHEATWQVFSEVVRQWSPEKSINDTICLACTRIIAKAWFNMENIPEEIVPLLKKAEYAVFNRDKVSNADFQKLKDEIRALNAKVSLENERRVLGSENYLKHMLGKGVSKNLEGLNALAALVVEGNITTVVTSAILQIASSKPIQDRLRAELSTLDTRDLTSLDAYQHKIKNLEFLNLLYLESLRYFSPAPPLVRYASKAGEVNGIKIPARSYLFVPLRSIMHDEKLWPNPDVFDPLRHKEGVSVNNFPLTPFSTGTRVCPASFGFAEAMFKIAIVALFKDQELKLTSHDKVETIPVATKEPRLRQKYLGRLQKPSAELESALPATPIMYAYSADSSADRSNRSSDRSSLLPNPTQSFIDGSGKHGSSSVCTTRNGL